MKASFTIIGALFLAAAVHGAAYPAGQRKLSSWELFQRKCTTCHAADKSLKRRASPEQFLTMIKTMQLGAKATDRELERIAAFLGDPDRPLFEVKCTRCHGMKRIEQARLERKKEADILALVERMRAMDRTWIPEKDAQALCRYMSSVYSPR
jgi:cytochrome c5